MKDQELHKKIQEAVDAAIDAQFKVCQSEMLGVITMAAAAGTVKKTKEEEQTLAARRKARRILQAPGVWLEKLLAFGLLLSRRFFPESRRAK